MLKSCNKCCWLLPCVLQRHTYMASLTPGLSSHTPDNSDMLLYKALTAKWAFFSQACNTTDQRAQPALPNAYSLSILY